MNNLLKELLKGKTDGMEDLVAGTIGMKTFLIEDNRINREKKEPNPDFMGGYGDLLRLVMELENLKGK